MPNQGVVKFFDAREGKRFGFLKLENGNDLFFHFNDGQVIVDGKKAPEFSGSAVIEVNGKTRGLRDPRPDDILLFEPIYGNKGPKASPWGYLSHWTRAEEIIAARPVYRVLKTMNSVGETPRHEPEILWEGSDLEDLLKKFPLPKGNRSPGSDPLLPYYSDNDNIFEVHRWWEVKLPDGSWKQTRDPRPLPGVLRQFESISYR
jgi:hypothetical protein